MTGAGTICGGWPGWAWYGCIAPQSRPSPTGDALAAADRALAGGREAPLSPLTDDRYADLLASSLRDVEASAARSSRRRGLLSSPEEAAAALDRLDHRGY